MDLPNPSGKKPIRFYPDPKMTPDIRPGFTFQQMQSGISGGLVDDSGRSFVDGAGNQIVPDGGRQQTVTDDDDDRDFSPDFSRDFS